MAAQITLEGISITRVNMQGHMGATEFDGVVTLRAQSDGLDFKYAYKFSGSQSHVPGLVANAIALLRRELQELLVESEHLFQRR